MRKLLPVLVVLFAALAAAFAVAIGVMLLSSGSGSLSGPEVGVVLIYEVDPQFTPDPDRVDMQRLVDSIDGRLYLGRHKAARVRELDDGRSYLADAARDRDQAGNPCVAFRFNAAGARLFGRLTSLNLPNKVQDFYRKLGIILDGRLHSAPRIMTTIRSRGVITDSFTEEEADDLATLLNAASLAAPVRQVEKRIVDNED